MFVRFYVNCFFFSKNVKINRKSEKTVVCEFRVFVTLVIWINSNVSLESKTFKNQNRRFCSTQKWFTSEHVNQYFFWNISTYFDKNPNICSVRLRNEPIDVMTSAHCCGHFFHVLQFNCRYLRRIHGWNISQIPWIIFYSKFACVTRVRQTPIVIFRQMCLGDNIYLWYVNETTISRYCIWFIYILEQNQLCTHIEFYRGLALFWHDKKKNTTIQVHRPKCLLNSRAADVAFPRL